MEKWAESMNKKKELKKVSMPSTSTTTTPATSAAKLESHESISRASHGFVDATVASLSSTSPPPTTTTTVGTKTLAAIIVISRSPPKYIYNFDYEEYFFWSTNTIKWFHKSIISIFNCVWIPF